VFDRHREPWFRVECDGCRVALAGGLKSNLSGKPKNPTRINLVHSGGFGVLLKVNASCDLGARDARHNESLYDA